MSSNGNKTQRTLFCIFSFITMAVFVVIFLSCPYLTQMERIALLCAIVVITVMFIANISTLLKKKHRHHHHHHHSRNGSSGEHRHSSSGEHHHSSSGEHRHSSSGEYHHHSSSDGYRSSSKQKTGIVPDRKGSAAPSAAAPAIRIHTSEQAKETKKDVASSPASSTSKPMVENEVPETNTIKEGIQPETTVGGAFPEKERQQISDREIGEAATFESADSAFVQQAYEDPSDTYSAMQQREMTEMDESDSYQTDNDKASEERKDSNADRLQKKAKYMSQSKANLPQKNNPSQKRKK